MEKLPTNLERHMSCVDAPQFDERNKAHGLVKDIAGHAWRGRGDMVDRVYDVVRATFPTSHWTRRRIRAFWHREQAVTSWREIRELEFVAEVERTRRLQREASRARHNEFIAHIADTLDRLEIADAEFHREHRAALREMAFGSIDPQVGDASRQGDQAAALGCGNVEEVD